MRYVIAAVGLAASGLALAPPARATRTRLAPLAAKHFDQAGNPIKAALSAYMHFCNDERPGVTAEMKASAGETFKQTMVMSKLGAMWGDVPADRKAQYEAKAAADKERYAAALKAAGILSKKEQKAAKPKRPLSAYMHFCNDRRPAVAERMQAELGATFKYTLVMSKLGEEWRALDAGAKSKYEDMAAAAKAAAA
mmetsp:Transcript_21215/g.65240  ORF Transcript_21215/g.65240 Transcript_21215/m.65240 type:complete len:195 (+) Transcript_21215:46-630(+)